MLAAIASGCIAKTFLDGQISCCHDSKPVFSYMVAFGTTIKIANMLRYQKLGQTFGPKSFRET